MESILRGLFRLSILLLILGANVLYANPTGGTVTQGSATFSSSGSQFNINQTSANAWINWQSFNIGAGETTSFVQPSSTSVVWNHVNDLNPSQILGTLNANGYVILQNASGFYVGGQATINTHGLIMTTASTPMLNLSSGGPWSFNLPPPTAKIVNYGRINIAGGGPAFLIANDIENNGTISAPGGKIGLYAGQKVLISTSPDGRGLSAQATIPQGVVDNNGNLAADAGSITLHAQMVNQNGLIQANSAKEVNGTIELVGSDSVNLGAHSVISARGDTQGASPGGSVTIKSDNSFSDQAGSVINIAGGTQGGNGGEVEISAPQMSAINSSINGQAADGFASGVLTIDPYDILLSSSGDNAPPSGTVNPGDPPVSGTLTLNVNSFASTLSQINLQAQNNIELSTVWRLSDPGTTATLTLTAGNNITLDDGSGINAGNNWTLNLNAGNGIYLWGNSYIQAQNGNVSQKATINLYAANEVQVGWSGQYSGLGIANSGIGYIATVGGGSIDVETASGDVNTGGNTTGQNPSGFKFSKFFAPYYTLAAPGGISTTAGGNVKIQAGGNVVSYLPIGTLSVLSACDAGTGAFGTQPGDVTIAAGGNVYGHYVLVNGTGSISAGQDIGNASQNVALSLAKGSWDLNAGWNPVAQSVQGGVGDIYLQEVRNPNGIFNSLGSSARPGPNYHYFEYDPQASVSLAAGNGVYLTGQGLPRPSPIGGSGIDNVPVIMPSILHIAAGLGGVTLENNVTLYPSPYQDLQITTTDGGSFNGNGNELLMSDSAQTQWRSPTSSGVNIEPFSNQDHASTPPELNNYDPVAITIDGSMNNVLLRTDKATEINVGRDMKDCSFYGENMRASDITSITVGGQIYNAGSFNSRTLPQGIQYLATDDLPPGTANSWAAILKLAVDPSKLPASVSGLTQADLAAAINNARLFSGSVLTISTYLAYNPNTRTLTAIGVMPADLLTALKQPTLTVVRYNRDGTPVVKNGKLVTDTYYSTPTDSTQPTWIPSADFAQITHLQSDSLTAKPLGSSAGAYWLGGPGEFNVTAGSISLGNSLGIVSLGNGSLKDANYSSLTPYITSGAAINVKVAGNLDMASSTIAALGGGDVNVTSTGGSLNLGSSELIDFAGLIMQDSHLALGIYSSGGGDVSVSARKDINIDGSRIASFNGGNVSVTSLTGDVNVGSGGAIAVPVNVFSPYATVNNPFETVYVNGIAAETLTQPSLIPGSATVPGDITVSAPQGNIYANLGGIKQETLNGTVPTGPTITLTAGTPAPGEGFDSSVPPLYLGNIDLGTVGVIGETVIVRATGKITGLVISRYDATVTSQSVGSLTVLAGRTADVNAQSSGSGPITIIGGQGVKASGIGDQAILLGRNVSVNGGAAASTIGTSATATAASQSAAGQASNENQQQVASNSNEEKKKKKKKKAALVRSVGRVTVILPKTS